MSGKIFLNYRRSDSGPWTFLLRERLVAHFGENRVFHDLTGVPLGARVRQYLAAQVADCSVMVSVIGPTWEQVLAERAAAGGPDHVVIEIEEALRFPKPIVPVLAGGGPDAVRRAAAAVDCRPCGSCRCYTRDQPTRGRCRRSDPRA